jgi:serine/threonine protein kinase
MAKAPPKRPPDDDDDLRTLTPGGRPAEDEPDDKTAALLAAQPPAAPAPPSAPPVGASNGRPATTADYAPPGPADVAGPRGASGLPQKLGRYEIVRKIGEGGMGAVFLARDLQLNRDVALKVPRPEADRVRFLREARAAAALTHPNICPVYDVGEIDGRTYLCMAYIRGEPLSRVVGRDRPLEPRRAATVVKKIALAMQHAHDAGIIHRDLKPHNVLLDARDEPIVMDFGLARLADQLITQPGEVMGTPAYMPPEQIDGEQTVVGPKSDIYSLGVVLFQLLTGSLPFTGGMPMLQVHILTEPAPAPSSRRPGLSPLLDQACLKAMEKKPGDRWPTMKALAEHLDAFLRESPPIAAPPPPAPPPPPPPPAPPAPTPVRDRTEVIEQSEPSSATPLPSHTAPVASPLTLRVAGTDLAYRPTSEQAVIAVGRQKRRPGEPVTAGNDFVVRVEGNDELSVRISRRHLEMRREGGRWLVVDHSSGGTLRNGKPLPPGVPVTLAAGDRLTIAGVMTLEVLLRPAAVVAAAPQADVAAEAGGKGRVRLDVSLGDLVTLRPDE